MIQQQITHEQQEDLEALPFLDMKKKETVKMGPPQRPTLKKNVHNKLVQILVDQRHKEPTSTEPSPSAVSMPTSS